MMSATDVRSQLQELHAERALASLEGLAENARYMADLEHEIESARRAYVGAAVTEIALLRGDLSGRLMG